ncbi:hypothetical protein GBA52_021601 [Prunus armeniaca]|nr:hypothetical protein GBA52_021601 [Prunus armeniaca]
MGCYAAHHWQLLIECLLDGFFSVYGVKAIEYFAKRIYLYGFQTIHGEKAIQEALDKKLPVMCCIAAYESLASYKGGILDTQEFYGRTCLTREEDVWSWCYNCGYDEGFHVMCLTGHGIFKEK